MGEQSALPQLWEVPQKFRDRLGKQAGRQRAMLAEGHLLLVLHRPPDPEEVKRHGRYFWRQPDGNWLCSESGNGPQALSRHLNEYAELLEKLDQQEGNAASAEDHFAVLGSLASAHRAVRHMHQTLQDARKMVPQDRDLVNFRDRAGEIERAAELLYGETRNSLDLVMARHAEEQAQSSRRMAAAAHRLNLLVAFFFPVVTLSALFGVNMNFGLEKLAAPAPFVILVCLGLGFGFILKAFVAKESHETATGEAYRQGHCKTAGKE